MKSVKIAGLHRNYFTAFPSTHKSSKPQLHIFQLSSRFSQLPHTLTLTNASLTTSRLIIQPYPHSSSHSARLRVSSHDASRLASFPEDKEAPPTSSFAEFITSERVKVVAMLALALALCNADRVVMSVAIVPLSLSRGWSRSLSGIVQVVSLCLLIISISLFKSHYIHAC
jgi:hypothetical protein